MTTKLSMWTVDTTKWREENGLTGPEWDMFVDNKMGAYIFGLVAGTWLGYILSVGLRIT